MFKKQQNKQEVKWSLLSQLFIYHIKESQEAMHAWVHLVKSYFTDDDGESLLSVNGY